MNKIEQIQVTIQFFGKLRDCLPTETPLSFSVPVGMTVAMLREKLSQYLQAQQCDAQYLKTLAASVFAQGEILREQSKLSQSGEVAVLPPVCGG